MSATTSSVALSVAICTNRPRNIGNIVAAADSLAAGDELLVVLDIAPQDAPAGLSAQLYRPGVRMLPNGANRGLSYSRNRALAECAHRMLVFLDDDVTVSRDTLDRIRATAVQGVGIRRYPGGPGGWRGAHLPRQPGHQLAARARRRAGAVPAGLAGLRHRWTSAVGVQLRRVAAARA